MSNKKIFTKNIKKNLDFELTTQTYEKLIQKFKKKKKQIGLSVCDVNTYKKIQHLNFDFYKLLSIAINNYELIDLIKK